MNPHQRPDDPIKHVVFLLFENHSFDQMLGCFKQMYPDLAGVDPVDAAVNLGDDADTTGAICGQLAGAYWGESGIPKEWRDGLARPDMLEEALRSLVGNS